MSDTPRTDEADAGNSRFDDWGGFDPSGYVEIDFARQLERELNEAKDRISHLEDEITQLRAANLELTQTLNHRCERRIRN